MSYALDQAGSLNAMLLNATAQLRECLQQLEAMSQALNRGSQDAEARLQPLIDEIRRTLRTFEKECEGDAGRLTTVQLDVIELNNTLRN